jgi:uroporphyrinogen-III synthase
MKLLILRPQPGADATAQKAKEAGIMALKTPLFVVKEIAWSPPDPAHYDAILFTSANAVRHSGQGLKTLTGLPAYAVGEATAKLVRSGGFTIAATGKAGAEALVQLAAENEHKQLLWLTGEEHSEFSIADGTSASGEADGTSASGEADGTQITKKIVYHAQRLPMPEEMRNLLSSPIAVALHSARAATYFAEICDYWHIDRQHIILACLSSSIAASAGAGWGEALVADRPNDAEILSIVKSYFTSIANPS